MSTTQILVVEGGIILASGTCTISSDRVIVGGVDYPFASMDSPQVVSGVTLPIGFTPTAFLWNGSAIVTNPSYIPPQPDLRSQAAAAMASNTAALLAEVIAHNNAGNFQKAFSMYLQLKSEGLM